MWEQKQNRGLLLVSLLSSDWRNLVLLVTENYLVTLEIRDQYPCFNLDWCQHCQSHQSPVSKYVLGIVMSCVVTWNTYDVLVNVMCTWTPDVIDHIFIHSCNKCFTKDTDFWFTMKFLNMGRDEILGLGPIKWRHK